MSHCRMSRVSFPTATQWVSANCDTPGEGFTFKIRGFVVDHSNTH